MLQTLRPLLFGPPSPIPTASPNDPPSSLLRPLQLLDVGGGRGDLAICVATVFGPAVHVTVLDLNEKSLTIGAHIAANKGNQWDSYIILGLFLNS